METVVNTQLCPRPALRRQHRREYVNEQQAAIRGTAFPDEAVGGLHAVEEFLAGRAGFDGDAAKKVLSDFQPGAKFVISIASALP